MPYKKDLKNITPPIKHTALVCLLLVVAIVICYWQVVSYDFVGFDDDKYITNNLHVKAGLTKESLKWALTATHAGNWHPLAWLSHMLDIQLFGMDPGLHHLTNLLLHIANSLLLLLVLKRITGAFWRSCLVASLFALHPLNVESVAWISERKNVLSTLFGILALGGYSMYVEHPNTLRYMFVFLLLFLGLAAKPMLVTLPFVLILLDYWPLGRFQLERSGALVNKQQKSIALRLFWEKTPLFALITASCVVTFLVEQKGGTVASLKYHPLGVRIVNALVAYVAYIGKMLWPSHLVALYPCPGKPIIWQAAGAGLILLSITLLAVRAINHHPYFTVGWLWYLGTLVPVIGLVQVGSQAMADRYTYVPLVGLFILMAWGLHAIVTRLNIRRLYIGIAALVLGPVLMSTTWLQVRSWSNSITLFEHALAYTDNNYIMHYNLAKILKTNGRADEAAHHYYEALRINPSDVKTYYNLGNLLASCGRHQEAISCFLSALQIDSNDAEIHNNLGNSLQHLGRLDEAIRHYSEALRINSAYTEAHNNLGNILSNQGRLDEAIRHYAAALQIDPNHAEAHNNLGVVLAESNRSDEAVYHYFEALRLNPGYVAAHMNLGAEMNKQGRMDEAVSHYQKALTLQPKLPEAMYHLAKLYIDRSEYKKALSLYQKMIILLPDNSAVYYNIACIYASQNKPGESVAWLTKAVAKGFDNWEHIKADKDLDIIRSSIQYKAFIKGR